MGEGQTDAPSDDGEDDVERRVSALEDQVMELRTILGAIGTVAASARPADE